MNYNLKKGSSPAKKMALVVLMVTIVLGAVIVLYFTLFANPVRVYRNIVADAIDSMFVDNTLDKQGFNVELDASLELEDKDLEENPIIGLIDEVDLTFDVQIDNVTKEAVIHMDSTYDKEKLANISMFLNYEKSKVYIYAKEYFDKYVEMDLNEQLETVDVEQTQALKMKSEDDAKRIIKKELTSIITDEMCSKVENSYILKTTNVQLAKNISRALVALKLNEEFLSCFEKPEAVKELLESYIYIIDETELDEQEIKITLELGLFLNIEQSYANIAELAEVFVVKDGEKAVFEVKAENKTVMSGQVIEANDSIASEFTISVDEVGEISLKIKFKENEIKEFDKINLNQVKKLEDLTDDDMAKIMKNIEDAKLGEIIEEIEEYNRSIINKAQQAIIAAELANVRSLAQIAWIDAYMDGVRDDATLKNAVINELVKNNIDINKYNIDVTSAGVEVTIK